MSAAQQSCARKLGAIALLLLLSAGCSPVLDDLHVDDIDCEPTPNSRSGTNVDAQGRLALSTTTSSVPRTKTEDTLSAEPTRFASSALDEAFRPVVASGPAPATPMRAAVGRRLHE